MFFAFSIEAIDYDVLRRFFCRFVRRKEALVDRRLELVFEARCALDRVFGELGQLGDAAQKAGLKIAKVAAEHRDEE